MASLAEELGALKPTQLRRRAKAAGVPEETMEEAEDGDSPKATLIELIIATGAPLQAELAALKPTQLRKRAKASLSSLEAGASAEAIEEAEDSDSPKEALISLIVSAERGFWALDPSRRRPFRPGSMEAAPAPEEKALADAAAAAAEEMAEPGPGFPSAGGKARVTSDPATAGGLGAMMVLSLPDGSIEEEQDGSERVPHRVWRPDEAGQAKGRSLLAVRGGFGSGGVAFRTGGGAEGEWQTASCRRHAVA